MVPLSDLSDRFYTYFLPLPSEKRAQLSKGSSIRAIPHVSFFGAVAHNAGHGMPPEISRFAGATVSKPPICLFQAR